MASYNKRWQLIQQELLEKKGDMIYIEKKIKNIIQDRYADRSIDTSSSYVYQKMDKLLDKKIYIPLWNIGNNAHQIGFINVFELHKELEEIIRAYHLPRKKKNLYTREERRYMEKLNASVHL